MRQYVFKRQSANLWHSGIRESDDANPPHADTSVTEYRPKGQRDVTFFFFFSLFHLSHNTRDSPSSAESH